MIPRMVPVIRCGHVSSGNRADAGMKGLKFAARGFVGRAPTISGYSCGGFALSIVDICESDQDSVEKHNKQVGPIFAQGVEAGAPRLLKTERGKVRDYFPPVRHTEADPSPKSSSLARGEANSGGNSERGSVSCSDLNRPCRGS